MYRYPVKSDWLTSLWEPVSFVRLPVFLYLAMVLLIFITSFFELLYHSEIQTLAGVMYITGLVIFLSCKTPLRRSFIAWVLLASILVPLITWVLMKLEHPDMARSAPNLDDLITKFLFIIPAFMLAGSQKNLFWVWGAAAVSALIMPWVAGDGWQEFVGAWAGRRATYGDSPIAIGIVYGTLLIAVFIFGKKVVFKPAFSYVRCCLWLCLLVYIGFLTFTTQSRAVYLGIAVVMTLAVLCLAVYCGFSGSGRFPKKRVIVPLLVVVVVGLVVLFNSATFDQTIAKTQNEIRNIMPALQGDVEDIPRSSAGLRLIFWVDATHWTLERPLFGWGYRAGRMMHDEAQNYFNAPSGRRLFRTIHNTYLELTISYGLVGLALFTAFFVWFFRRMHMAWKDGVLPQDIYVFTVFALIFYAVCGVFYSSLFIGTPIFLFNMVLLGAATFIFKHIVEYEGDAAFKVETEAGSKADS
ncbi:MAG: O-antigen ligase family protein [Saccharospirillum sp.]|uniref:O-antigen ligase family protein n=1 Tax=Saccharospirillum sp. TaxID=2033801 RepID=UPI003296A96A